MTNKYTVLMSFLLLFALSLEGMFKYKKPHEHTFEQDGKTKIQTLDDVKKLKEDQQQYRGKHKLFKDEPNDVRLNVSEQK